MTTGTLLVRIGLSDGSSVELCTQMDVDFDPNNPQALLEAEQLICQKVADGFNMFANIRRRPMAKVMSVLNAVWS